MRRLAVIVALVALACGDDGEGAPTAAVSAPPPPIDASPSPPDATIDLDPMPDGWTDPVPIVDADASCGDVAACRERCKQKKISAACRKIFDLQGGAPDQRKQQACASGDGAACRALGNQKRADALDRAGCDAGDHWACARHPQIAKEVACERGNAYSCDTGALAVRVGITHCMSGDAHGCMQAVLEAGTRWRPVRARVVPQAQRRCEAGDREACRIAMWLLDAVDGAAARAAARRWVPGALADCGAGQLIVCTQLLGSDLETFRMAMPRPLREDVAELIGPDRMRWLYQRGCELDLYAQGRAALDEFPCQRFPQARDLFDRMAEGNWRPPVPEPPPETSK